MRRWIAVLVAVIALVVFAVVPALAHEGREVGDYTLYFGWRGEPAFAGVLNGPEVYIEMTDGSDLPADLEIALQVEVTFGADTIVMALEPAWNETGHYLTDLLPTLPGDYTFVLTGTIGETAVNETFTSADGEFSTVEPMEDVAFPPLSSLEARIAALEARIAELEAAIAGS
jgi:hypothetical protein